MTDPRHARAALRDSARLQFVHLYLLSHAVLMVGQVQSDLALEEEKPEDQVLTHLVERVGSPVLIRYSPVGMLVEMDSLAAEFAVAAGCSKRDFDHDRRIGSARCSKVRTQELRESPVQ